MNGVHEGERHAAVQRFGDGDVAVVVVQERQEQVAVRVEGERFVAAGRSEAIGPVGDDLRGPGGPGVEGVRRDETADQRPVGNSFADRSP